MSIIFKPLRVFDVVLDEHLSIVENAFDAVGVLKLPETQQGFKQGQRYSFALHEIRLLLMEREKLRRVVWISIGCHILTAIYLTAVGIISLLK